eukprot:COSAG06_NODE_52096_length_307_cov_93.009615_1_plen_35_part_01
MVDVSPCSVELCTDMNEYLVTPADSIMVYIMIDLI